MEGILTGSILAFCRAMGEFGATILIAGNIPKVTRTMPLAIYSHVEAGQYMDAFELVIYICVLTLALLSGIHLITKGPCSAIQIIIRRFYDYIFLYCS